MQADGGEFVVVVVFRNDFFEIQKNKPKKTLISARTRVLLFTNN
jgi:hypothetical protein